LDSENRPDAFALRHQTDLQYTQDPEEADSFIAGISRYQDVDPRIRQEYMTLSQPQYCSNQSRWLLMSTAYMSGTGSYYQHPPPRGAGPTLDLSWPNDHHQDDIPRKPRVDSDFQLPLRESQGSYENSASIDRLFKREDEMLTGSDEDESIPDEKMRGEEIQGGFAPELWPNSPVPQSVNSPVLILL
jgi:hypothetical protein